MVSFERGNFEGGIPSHIIEVTTEHGEAVHEKIKSQVVAKEFSSSEQKRLIDTYVDKLIEKIKQATQKKEKIKLIKEMVQVGDVFHIKEIEDQPTITLIDEILSPQYLSATETFSYEDIDAYRAKVEEVRKKVVEQLKYKITHDLELSHLDLHNINEVNYSLADEGRIAQVTSLEGKEAVVRNDAFETIAKNTHDIEVHKEALKKFITLPQNDYVLSYLYYSPEDEKGMVKKLELHTLSGLLFYDRSNVGDMLKVVEDCMKGATFLESHGLIMQDIYPSNLGYTEDKTRKPQGILFDLEGLYLRSAQRTDRLVNQEGVRENTTKIPNFLPPETHKVRQVKNPESQQVNYELEPTPVTGAEMTYQFGMCLKKVLESDSFSYMVTVLDQKKKSFAEKLTLKKTKSVDIVQEMQSLIQAMTYYDPSAPDPIQKHISLSEAQVRVEKLIAKIQKFSA